MPAQPKPKNSGAASFSENDLSPKPSAPMKINGALTRGANVSEAQMERLKRDGFRSIVSLNLEGDEDPEHAPKLGLKAFSVPVLDQWHPTVAQVDQFLATVTSGENQPTYVHCAGGDGRTSIFVACYRLAVEHWPLNDTLAEASSFGRLTHEQQEFIERFSHSRNQ